MLHLPRGLGLPTALPSGLVLFRRPLQEAGAHLSPEQVLEQLLKSLHQTLWSRVLLELQPPSLRATDLVIS